MVPPPDNAAGFTSSFRTSNVFVMNPIQLPNPDRVAPLMFAVSARTLAIYGAETSEPFRDFVENIQLRDA